MREGALIVTYRLFDKPAESNSMNTGDWIRWMKRNDVLHTFLPAPQPTCGFCGAPCGEGYPTCPDCRSMTAYVDSLVVGSYSLHPDLESLIGTYKSGLRKNRWQAMPLGSLFWAIMYKHADCFAEALGPNPIYTYVPSDDEKRPFDHLYEILNGVEDQWTQPPWLPDLVVRDRSHPRPARKAVAPEAYEVRYDVRGRSVLLFDDLWTSGASMSSAAAALKSVGAEKVVGVVLGRHLNPNNSWGEAPRIRTEVAARGWNLDTCALCP
jgi:predicted amidophosphoribosyltransferase